MTDCMAGAGPNVTSEIQQSAAHIISNSPRGEGAGMRATMDGAPATTRTTTMAHNTDGPGMGRDMTGSTTRGDGLAGTTDSSIAGDRV